MLPQLSLHLILLYGLVLLGYLWLATRSQTSSPLWYWVLPAHLGLVLHALFASWPALHMGFAIMLSLALWVNLLILWVERRRHPLVLSLRLHAFLAVGVVPLALFFPGFTWWAQALDFWVHWLFGLAAFTLYLSAAGHAVFILIRIELLRTSPTQQFSSTAISPWRQWLQRAQWPPLLVFEALLVRYLRASTIFLTLSMASGIVVQALAPAPRWLTHKNIFMLVAWLALLVILYGVKRFGWRGRGLCYATLIGFSCSFLGYEGSRFVLEVLLQRPLA